MGLNKQTQTNALYLLQGKIIKAATQENGTLEKNGKFYEEFVSISGRLTDFNIVDGYQEGEQSVALQITDFSEVYTLYFGLKSGYWRSFARAIENADLMTEIELYPVLKTENEIKKSSLLMRQGDNWIKGKYTYENMGDMPYALPVEVNGKTVYDYSAQNEFLISKIKAKFVSEKLPF